MVVLAVAGSVLLLLTPLLMLALVVVVVPLVLSLQRRWSPPRAALAAAAAVLYVGYVVLTARRADANPSGSAEGPFGDAPGPLFASALLAGLALVPGRRARARAGEQRDGPPAPSR